MAEGRTSTAISLAALGAAGLTALYVYRQQSKRDRRADPASPIGPSARRLSSSSPLSEPDETPQWLQTAAEQLRVTPSASGTQRPHDVGGATQLLSAPLPTDKPNSAWEFECHALFACLAKAGLASTDELRRCIEALPRRAYDGWSYYEKWSAALAQVLRERGHLRAGELEAELFADDEEQRASGAGRAPPRFEVGDAVVVRANEKMRTAWRAPHIRTPGYVFGARGVVERRCGAYADPALLAYGVPSPRELQLYRVRFARAELWPEVRHGSGGSDTVDVDVFENWLLDPREAAAVQPRATDAGAMLSYGDGTTLAGCPVGDAARGARPHKHSDGGTHVHLTRPEVEAAAVQKEGEPSPGAAVHRALLAIALRRELVTRASITAGVRALEAAGADPKGARLVARAWVDAGFASRLITDANAAAAELGIEASNPNAPTKLVVVRNDSATHNLVVCTLCSCYPTALLGPSPSWYKSRSYRARAVRQPRSLLRDEFGLELSEGVALRVHDSTADLRYMVLPARPTGTEALDEEQLRALVTRDGMIGVAAV